MSDGTFRGEDENAGANHPLLDLVAGLFLLAIGIWFAAMSVALPVPFTRELVGSTLSAFAP